jgi:hypothetical protein
MGMGGIEHIRKTYGVPAKRGGRIRFEGRIDGKIVDARYGRLRVKFPYFTRIVILHPTRGIEYLTETDK